MIPSRRLQAILPEKDHRNHCFMVDVVSYQNDTPELANESLREVFLSTASTQIDVLRSMDFDVIRRDFPTSKNVINYPTNLLKIVLSNPEEYLDRETGVVENIRTAITEHAIADALGVYRFSDKWERQNDNSIRLKTPNGYLDEIIYDGIHDNTGQIPAFEIPRNEMDARVLDIVTRTRQNGDNSKVIKFSPSPPDMNDPEVQKRGTYKGNDQICVFELDEFGNEQQTIYWFTGISESNYRNLAEELISADPFHPTSLELRKSLDNSQLNSADLRVMEFSNKFSEQQVCRIMQFVTENQNKALVNKFLVEGYANAMRERVKEEIMPDVYMAGRMIIQNDSDAVRLYLSKIDKAIDRLQFDLRLFIRDKGGFDTFEKSVSEKIIFEWDSYNRISLELQQEHVSMTGYRATGCGFGFSSRQALITSGSYLWGPMSVSMPGDELFDNGSTKYKCPGCLKVHDIRGGLIDFCECGFDARCETS